MSFAAGLDVGAATVTAWVAGTGGELAVTRSSALPVRRPAPGRAEFDPTDWWAVCRATLAAAIAGAPGPVAGLTVSAAQHAFVLTDRRVELGHGVLGEDERGVGWVDEIAAHRQVYAMTRRRPTPEPALAKLLAIRHESPRRWAAARRLLFLPDWLIWRLTGVAATEVSQACAGQLAHVSQRAWAWSLLDDVGISRELLAPLVEPGVVVGQLRERDLGLPVGLPVVAGCGDIQLVAAGSGAAHPGAVCVVAGAQTTIVAGADSAPLDPLRRPDVSTHVPRDMWAVEMDCGAPGAMLPWLGRLLGGVEDLYGLAAGSAPGAGGLVARVDVEPRALSGLHPEVHAADLAAAVTEGYAYAVRTRLDTLEEVLDGPVAELALAGPGAGQGLARLLADVTGRPVSVPSTTTPAVLAGVALVSAATGDGGEVAVPSGRRLPAGDRAAYDEPYQRYLATAPSSPPSPSS